MQQELSLNSIYFYILLYFGTVLFYTYAYMQERVTIKTSNRRTNWYSEHWSIIRKTQAFYLAICIATGLYLLVHYRSNLGKISFGQMAPLIATGLIALSYYGIPFGILSKLNVRRTGWMKPFAIGLVWATAVTYVPIIWHQVENNKHYTFNTFNAWFFLKNFMYISLLAILFDIKDYAADHNKKLKTFVVRIGIRKTIFYIIMPLTIAGFVAFLLFASILHFPLVRILINSIPFILLLVVTYGMQQRKSIVYYLIVIDGLMLVKGLCGITATLLTAY